MNGPLQKPKAFEVWASSLNKSWSRDCQIVNDVKKCCLNVWLKRPWRLFVLFSSSAGIRGVLLSTLCVWRRGRRAEKVEGDDKCPQFCTNPSYYSAGLLNTDGRVRYIRTTCLQIARWRSESIAGAERSCGVIVINAGISVSNWAPGGEKSNPLNTISTACYLRLRRCGEADLLQVSFSLFNSIHSNNCAPEPWHG